MHDRGSRHQHRSGARALSAPLLEDRPGDFPAWLIVLTEPAFLALVGLVVLGIAGEVWSPSHADWLLPRG